MEIPIIFSCENSSLVGILHKPEITRDFGVVIIVGGPQYRVGSHRQFLLLARDLEKNGIPVFRFDYRSMGDGEGDQRDFERIETDIACAIAEFTKQIPSIKRIVLWGLCDAASAAMFYAHRDSRVAGMVLLNPWIRTQQGIAKAYLRNYYISRLTDRNLWLKIIKGEFKFFGSIRSFLSTAKSAVAKNSGDAPASEANTANTANTNKPLPERMLAGFSRFSGNALFILSGDDLTAQEFKSAVSNSREWQSAMKRSNVNTHEMPEANHTFSTKIWRDEVSRVTVNWINEHL